MTSQTAETPLITHLQPVVATYATHADAESAVRQLVAGGLPITSISIVGRNFETHDDIQGFYRPSDAALSGAGQGAWFGGLFGLMFGAMGMFIMPIAGLVLIMGPLSGLVAGAIGGAGIGAFVSGLIALGIPKDYALKYQERLQAGEFLVTVNEGAREKEVARGILVSTPHTSLLQRSITSDALELTHGNTRI